MKLFSTWPQMAELEGGIIHFVNLGLSCIKIQVLLKGDEKGGVKI